MAGGHASGFPSSDVAGAERERRVPTRAASQNGKAGLAAAASLDRVVLKSQC